MEGFAPADRALARLFEAFTLFKNKPTLHAFSGLNYESLSRTMERHANMLQVLVYVFFRDTDPAGKFKCRERPIFQLCKQLMPDSVVRYNRLAFETGILPCSAHADRIPYFALTIKGVIREE
jgi:hypothetical protein